MRFRKSLNSSRIGAGGRTLSGYPSSAKLAHVARCPSVWPSVQLPACVSRPSPSAAARRIASARASSMVRKPRVRRTPDEGDAVGDDDDDDEDDDDSAVGAL